jgi:hypothetical protein
MDWLVCRTAAFPFHDLRRGDQRFSFPSIRSSLNGQADEREGKCCRSTACVIPPIELSSFSYDGLGLQCLPNNDESDQCSPVGHEWRVCDVGA